MRSSIPSLLAWANLVLVSATLTAAETCPRPAGSVSTRSTRNLRLSSPPFPFSAISAQPVLTPGAIDRLLGLASADGKFLPEPPRRVLYRRGSLVVTGLPPQPKEIDAFAGSRDPQAWDKAIDKWFESPQAAVPWTERWLSLAGYIDALPGEQTHPRQQLLAPWKWRDGLLQSFTQQVPMKKLITQQIIGDETAAGRAATYWQFFGSWPLVQPKELPETIATGQLERLDRLYLGVGLSCAGCHDHPRWPITPRDFTALKGVFLNSRIIEAAGPGRPLLNRTPLPLGKAASSRTNILNRLADNEELLQGRRLGAHKAMAEERQPQTAQYVKVAWAHRENLGFALADAKSNEGLDVPTLRRWLDYLRLSGVQLLRRPWLGNDESDGVIGWASADQKQAVLVNVGQHVTAVRDFGLPKGKVAVWNDTTEGTAISWQAKTQEIVVVSGSVTTAPGPKVPLVRWQLVCRTGKSTEALASGTVTAPERPQAMEGPALQAVKVMPGSRIEVLLTPDEPDALEAGLYWIDLTIKDSTGKPIADLSGDLLAPLASGSTSHLNPHPSTVGTEALADSWFFYAPDSPRTAEALHDETPAVKTAWKDFLSTPKDEAKLTAAATIIQRSHLLHESSPFLDDSPWADVELPKSDQDAIKRLEAKRAELLKALPQPEITDTVLEGGLPGTKYAGFRDPVFGVQPIPRSVPALLAGGLARSLGGASSSGRAELAQWLASSPLVARVMVNRLWETYFPRPLVPWAVFRGEADAPPLESQALDALAARLLINEPPMAIAKDILRTAAFKADWSSTTAPTRAVWQPRLFTPSEMRDSVLALTDRLNPELKGPSSTEAEHLRRSLFSWRTIETKPLALDNDFWPKQSKAIASVAQSAGDATAAVTWLHRHWLGRSPTAAELQHAEDQIKAGSMEKWIQSVFFSEAFVTIE